MDLIWSIFVNSIEIIILVTGLVGMILSLFLILAPEWFQSLSGQFNYWINFDKKIAFLDKQFKTDHFIYRHHLVSGAVLVAGSVFFLYFLYFQIDTEKIVAYFLKPGKLLTINEVILNASVILGKITGLAGIVLGVILLIDAGKIREIERTMASGLQTQPFVDKLNKVHTGVDNMFLRHPVIFGLAGLIASMQLSYVGSIFLTS